MKMQEKLSRRSLLFWAGIAANGLIAAVLAVPLVRFLLSPLLRQRARPYESWVSLGELSQFPTQQTRLATFESPNANPWDGETAHTACWVRRIDEENLQVFAVNCAHLGCPVRWFPQSKLFLCPCHGGAYYEDGSRASGPPERGLFQYAYKVVGTELLIKAGELPTPGASAALFPKVPPCA